MSTYPKVDIDGNQFLSRQHQTSGRSIETKRLYTEGVTSLIKPFYFSRIVGGSHYASIYNDNTPMQTVEKHYIDGVLVDKTASHISRGESFIDGRLYDEGVNHFYPYVLRDMGYTKELGPVVSIRQEIGGVCKVVDGVSCDTTGIYRARIDGNTVGDLTYLWEVVGGTVSSGQGTSKISIDTSGSTDVEIEVTLTVSDDFTSTVAVSTFIHSRVLVFTPVSLSNLQETVSGSCEYVSLSSCSAISTYTVDALDYVSLEWIVTGASIASGQGTTSITVETNGSMSLGFEVKCIAYGLGGDSKVVFGIFVHTREEVGDPVEIASLTELVAGSCDYPALGSCIATSTYQVVGSEYDTIVWNVIGATIESGQGTDTIIVTSDDSVDTLFDVEVVLSGFYGGTADTSGSYSHTRTEIVDEFDQALLYDINNIATEFIA